MIKEKVNKNINNIFASEKEVSIFKHFSEPKSSLKSNKAFLYSEPPEVILQSKLHIILIYLNIYFII